MALQSLEEFQQSFNQALEQYIDQELARYRARTDDQLLIGALEQVKSIALSGGKRLRPYLVYLEYCAAGGDESAYRPDVGIAIELFHLFGLIHDDIIDRGATRHGVATIHEYIRARLDKEETHGDKAHIASGQALLVGDIVFAWVTKIIANTGREHGENGDVMQQYFYQMVDDVLIGQMIDVDMTVRPHTTSERIDEKMLLKTASYTFVRPLQIGVALAAREEEALMRFCHDFGERLGLAFQIQDDLFDIVADPAVLHKSTMGDLRDRNHTVFTQYIAEHGTSAHRQQLAALSGRVLSPLEVQAAQDLFRQSGAIAYGEERLQAYLSEASALIEGASVDAAAAFALRELVDRIRSRKA